MPRFLWLMLVASLASTPVVFGQSQPKLTPDQAIKAADRNQDGRVDRVEFLTHMTEAFYMVDADKDGFISIVEYQKAVQGADAKRFQATDRNNDGKISLDEFQQAVSQDFDAADRNRDGVLDAEELTIFLRSR